MAKTLCLSALAAVVLVVAWIRLEEPQHITFSFVLSLVLAVIAAAIPRVRWRVPAVVGALIIGMSVAFDTWPTSGAFFTKVGDRFGGGFLDFYEFRLPIDPALHSEMHMVLLFAAFAFTLAVTLATAMRRSILTVAIFLVGAGWPATLLGGGHELTRGAFILAAALILLAGLSGRATHIAVPASLIVVLAALALSAAPAVAKPGFLDWQHWNPYVRPVKPVSVSYVWDSQYNGITFPKKVTTVFTVRAPQSIGTYWRATVLDAFVGDHWREHPWEETAYEGNQLEPERAWANRPNASVEQDITVEGLADKHLVAASLPMAYNVSEPAAYLGQDIAIARGGLHRGQRYIAWSYVAKPTPQQLLAARAIYPASLTKRGRELDVAPGVTAPALGKPGRDAVLTRELRGRLIPYAQLFDRARSVTGSTHSPYAAVVALEQWFRVTGGFTYSTSPPQTPGVPPLVGFALQTKTGYCQHFAGAMALMARLLGIPARVAVGFVRGHYVDGEWQVTDHDAHAWVEVWFPEYGWLPFDPTPGRGRLAGSYSSTSTQFDASAEAKLFSGVVRGGEVFSTLKGSPDTTPKRGTSLHSRADVGVRGLNPDGPHRKTHSLVLFLLLLAAGVVAVIAGVKWLRRRLRYATRDPRRVATACGRDLVDFLQDQRIAVAPNATFGDLADVVSERLVVDARAFADAAELARFGPPRESRTAARQARRELRDLKRALRRRIFVLERARGLVSLRSLGFA
jgi:transglutaminase-like putative cysteine protease